MGVKCFENHCAKNSATEPIIHFSAGLVRNGLKGDVPTSDMYQGPSEDLRCKWADLLCVPNPQSSAIQLHCSREQPRLALVQDTSFWHILPCVPRCTLSREKCSIVYSKGGRCETLSGGNPFFKGMHENLIYESHYLLGCAHMVRLSLGLLRTWELPQRIRLLVHLASILSSAVPSQSQKKRQAIIERKLSSDPHHTLVTVSN